MPVETHRYFNKIQESYHQWPASVAPLDGLVHDGLPRDTEILSWHSVEIASPYHKWVPVLQVILSLIINPETKEKWFFVQQGRL